jgi:hypothetical protein
VPVARALLCLSCLLLCRATPVQAQSAPPVINARSRIVTITDGVHLKKDHWYVMPDKSPDVYYVEIPLEPHTVTFTTDVDSISFDVTYGSTHRFIIRLADGTEALTEIRTEFRELLRHEPVMAGGPPNGTPIPFTIGDNDKIYVKGRINGGRELSFQLDLGAGGSIIKKGSVPKVRMTFDGTVNLRNSDGENVVPSSSTNDVEIGTVRWRRVGFVVADNMTHREDGLLGNSLFRDKVLEIDYGRQVLVIHDARPSLSGDWHREDIFLDGGTVPFVRGSMAVGGATRQGWFMLDTGAYTSILNSPDFVRAHKFRGEARRLLWPSSPDPNGPVIGLAGRMLSGTNYSVNPYDGSSWFLGLLGNDILKRFDLILDNQRGAAFFRPNAHLDAPYRNPERLVIRAASVVGVVGAAVVIWRRRAWRR